MRETNTYDRFWNKVEVSANKESCWNWNACVNGHTKKHSYGSFWNIDRQVYAHRFAYENFVGTIPAGMGVYHRCDNPRCVKPDHLWIGYPKDNTADAIAKGRLTGRPRKPTTLEGRQHG